MNGGEQQPPSGERLTDEVLLGRAMPGLRPEGETGRPHPGLPEEREGEADEPSPRIYVASLSDYNAGRLHGRWIDAHQSVEDIETEIQEMLAESVELGAEEWAIHDYEGFGTLQLSEYESLWFVSDVASGIAEHGEAFAAFAEVAERDPDRLPFFEDMYRGTWESVEAYAAHLVEDLGVEEQLQQLPEWVRPYVSVDIELLARDLEGGSVVTATAIEGGVHVFDFE